MYCNHTCKECGALEQGNWTDDAAKKLTAEQLCFKCNFWHEKIAIKDDPYTARINGVHYHIGREDLPANSMWRGFGGARSVIVFNDGRRIESRNLWTQGAIPERFKERLPDNATFEVAV